VALFVIVVLSIPQFQAPPRQLTTVAAENRRRGRAQVLRLGGMAHCRHRLPRLVLPLYRP
jgi:hypothetical protein